MGFQIVYGSPQTIWAKVKGGATVYTGGLVGYDRSQPSTDYGIVQLPVAAGVANLTNFDVPLGVCVGNNLKNKLYSSTYQTDYITATAAGSEHGDTTEYFGVEGPWAKGDKLGMVEIALITPSTVLRAPIRNAAIGTPPTLLTVTTGSTTGAGCTTNATQFTPVAAMSTIYCRTGGNAGAYRQLSSTSTTVHTVANYFTSDIAVGDTFVATGLNPVGYSFMQLGATASMWVEASAQPATDYFIIHVVELDLREAGKETVTFMFDGTNFLSYRAAT